PRRLAAAQWAPLRSTARARSRRCVGWEHKTTAGVRSAAVLTVCLALSACAKETVGEQTSALPCLGAPVTMGFTDFLDRMTDLDQLRQRSGSAECPAQASSYDRRSVSPGNDDWFANLDRGQYLKTIERNGRTEWVLAEVDGPGAILRFWSANPSGNLRIYIDSFDTPAFEANMESLMSAASSDLGEPFGYVAARGHNLYFPFPFSERARVTTDLDADQGMYFHVGYTRFPAESTVEAFATDTLERYRSQIDVTRSLLTDPWATAVAGTSADLDLSTDDFQTLAAPNGGGVLRELTLRPADVSEEALRSAVLVLRFDGQETIRSPVGDFFGTGPGLNPHRSIALRVDSDGTLSARFPMPFSEQMEIALLGGSATGSAMLDTAPFDATLGYFHAWWHRSGAFQSVPRRDWNFVELQGSGVYVGNVLNVVNPTPVWWGEGDERIYIDGDDFPSFFGTGTEDYYGYAWVDPTLFSRPYHAQSRVDGPDNYGHTSLLRLHVLDPIPFRERLRFDMEVWHWGTVQLEFDNVNYWYAPSTTTHNLPMPTDFSLPVIVEPEN
ncbi:MAG: glycoside hydrolase family 172 protein, partial [Myxococcota bacterium]